MPQGVSIALIMFLLILGTLFSIPTSDIKIIGGVLVILLCIGFYIAVAIYGLLVYTKEMLIREGELVGQLLLNPDCPFNQKFWYIFYTVLLLYGEYALLVYMYNEIDLGAWLYIDTFFAILFPYIHYELVENLYKQISENKEE